MDDLTFVWQSLPELLVGFPGHRPGGILLSLVLAASSAAAGMVLAVVLGSMSASTSRVLRVPATTYVWIIRGVPLILLLLLVHNVSSPTTVLGTQGSPTRSALIALSLYSTAYFADPIRAGLRSVPSQLIEDAALLGSRRSHTLIHVRLPFALRSMFPGLTTQAVTIFKDTSVVVVIGVADLTTNAQLVLGADVANSERWIPLYLAVGSLYFVTALALTKAASVWELRLTRSRSAIDRRTV